MDILNQRSLKNNRREWRYQYLLMSMYIILLSISQSSQETTKSDVNLVNSLDSSLCHNCRTNNSLEEYFIDVIGTISNFTNKDFSLNKTILKLEDAVETILDAALRKDEFVVIDGVEVRPVNKTEVDDKNKQEIKEERKDVAEVKGRALFSKFTYEYRMYQKIKDFINTHILSINLPMAAKSFGLNKFFIPLLIGGQVLIKSILFAMFLPSILGSFGKILGKGISQLSAASSQASYPPANGDQVSYNSDNKDVMGYETNQEGTFTYPQEGLYAADTNDVNDLSNVDMSRFGADSQKMAYLPSQNSYYKNQMGSAANNYKVFQKIPASSMILSNYDPFYSPLLSRLDGIFARLGLAPSENTIDSDMQIGGQSLSDVKLEACREQLICHMYASPGKYAPYSNLVSAQLSRELNELRRPVSDNPEILRFFRYMRAARRGQEGVDCDRVHPACTSSTSPQHTMFAAYHDINKLVTARKLH